MGEQPADDPVPDQEPDLLTVREVARMLRCSIDHVKRLCDAAQLEYIRIGARTGAQAMIRIERAAVFEFIESRRVEVRPEQPEPEPEPVRRRLRQAVDVEIDPDMERRMQAVARRRAQQGKKPG